jgi:hypothetical protein
MIRPYRDAILSRTGGADLQEAERIVMNSYRGIGKTGNVRLLDEVQDSR